MQADSDPKKFQPTLALQQQPVGIGERDFGKADLIASAKLCSDTQIDRDHVRYFRVTTDGLAISQK